MNRVQLTHDPYNLIITGVGGQGNVLASRVVGDAMSRLDFIVTIGETFGASQRGGSVMSHLRISSRSALSPQIPKGRAHMILALEPAEAIRVLRDYGNPGVKVLCSTRPIYPVGVICGERSYPPLEEIKRHVRELSESAWFVDPTEEAVELGSPIFGNIMMVGALAATGVLPLNRVDFEWVISQRMSPDKISLNLTAFDKGGAMVSGVR